jgi:hypothetical protein
VKFLLDWLKKTGSNPNQLAKKLGVDRPLVDRWLGKTVDTKYKKQSRFDIRLTKKLRELMGLSVEEFYSKLEKESQD